MSINLKLNIRHLESAQRLVEVAYHDLKNIDAVRSAEIHYQIAAASVELIKIIEKLNLLPSQEENPSCIKPNGPTTHV